ncbi:MAG: 50S ribosomal protein L18e [Candidatus Aenigmarchaeota archaeon]|nr:50S ribosomal protein L18e [Candidatus Aenigmarchaeota archaeon]
MRTGPTNENVKALILALRKESTTAKSALWDRIADDIEKATRQRREVNLSRLSRNTKANETVVVPGKVLGAGILAHAVVVAALNFSASARVQIEKASGRAITIAELVKQNPKGKDIRVIG